jgi:pyridoxamine 5'-phosphate oxidase
VAEPRDRPLSRADLDPDPLRQFARWFDEAAGVVRAPEAMAIATANASGVPSVRMVLLKRFDDDGLVFFTHYTSRKGRQLEENPRAALLLYWDPLGRQVRVEGRVERTPSAESDAYFETRPHGARVSALVSRQSEVIEGRDELEAGVTELGAAPAARPEWWGGFRLVPEAWEFWQHRADRLHDRFRYRADNGAWVIERLAP